LQATKLILVTKANSEWNKMNLTKQFEIQISIWGKFQFLNWGRSEFPKLLLILHNNLKNFQQESCSNFSALQLSCWSLFKIPNRF
jgi:hypothetical protein